MGYGWVITEDKLNDSKYSRKGVCGPNGMSFTLAQIAADGRKFRMLDDDGILYYEGTFLGDDSCSGFEPLEDFGTPDAGATTIQYLVNGKWEVL